MATIGRRRAIASVGKLRLTGMVAWLAWLFIHVYYLSGFKNRTVVLFHWAWSYITFARGSVDCPAALAVFSAQGPRGRRPVWGGG